MRSTDDGHQPHSDAASVAVAHVPHAGGAIAVHLELQSPAGGNRLAHATVKALRAALAAAADDPAVALVVIRAAGDVFCAGGDQAEQAALDRAGFRAFLVDLTALYREIAACAVPVLACVQGDAVGGGAALALACDLVVCSEQARFAFPEARLGLAAPGFLLQRLLPRHKAAEAAFGGRALAAAELEALGVLRVLGPVDTFASACDTYVARVVRQGARGLRASKASMAAASAAAQARAMHEHVDIQCAAFGAMR